MLLRLCQFVPLVLLVFFLGCRAPKRETFEKIDPQLNNLKTRWFGVLNDDFRPMVEKGKMPRHLFWDPKPEWDLLGREVTVVIVTPKNSPYSYQLDLNSGRPFYGYSYCSQKDVSEKFSGSFSNPPFAIGVLPRHLDQLGWPQNVYILGKKSWKQGEEARLRVIGSIWEEVCLGPNCLSSKHWPMRLSLVVVHDSETKEHQDFGSERWLKAHSWEGMKAWIENQYGGVSSGTGLAPFLRVKAVKSWSPEVEKYFRNKVKRFKFAQMRKIQENCHQLYLQAWNDVGEKTIFDRPAVNKKEFAEKRLLAKQLKAAGKPVLFHERLADFYKKYEEEFALCSKFIHIGESRYHSEKFWFLQQLSIFTLLHQDGIYFDCDRRAWHNNQIDSHGEKVYRLSQGITKCDSLDLDTAFQMMPAFLKNLKTTGRFYYRFVDFDHHSFGTHERIFSWVKLKQPAMNCSPNPNGVIQEKIVSFPTDVSWTKRFVKETVEDAEYIH